MRLRSPDDIIDICNSERHFKFYYWLANIGIVLVESFNSSKTQDPPVHLRVLFFLTFFLSVSISISLGGYPGIYLFLWKPLPLRRVPGAMNHPNPLDRRILIVDTYLTAKPFY